VGEPEYAAYKRDRDAEEKLLDRFRDPKDPLKIIIVTSKLLTGFDAPILQTMYLDKPLRDHTLLQAICRTNRPYGEQKTHGLIVDYLGIFDDVAQALKFDEEGVRKAVSNIADLMALLPNALQKCLAYFAGVDRTMLGYEGLSRRRSVFPTTTCVIRSPPSSDSRTASASASRTNVSRSSRNGIDVYIRMDQLDGLCPSCASSSET